MKTLFQTAASLALLFTATGVCTAQNTDPSAITIRFVNDTALPAQVNWNDNGRKVLYATLQPGQSYDQSTYVATSGR